MINRTTTARQLARKEKLDLDKLFAVIDNYGMDPQRLHADSVDLIKKELFGKTKRPLEERVFDFGSVGEDSIIKVTRQITNGRRKEEITLYMFAKDLENATKEAFEYQMPFNDFIEQIELDVDEIRPKLKKRNKSKSGPRKRKVELVRKVSEVGIELNLAKYLIEKNKEFGLRAMLYNDLTAQPVDLSHSSLVLGKIVPQEYLDGLRLSGYSFEFFSPEALMKKAQEIKTRRLSEKIKGYFSTGGGSFLSFDHGFNPDWNSDDSIRDVIYFLENHVEEPGRGLPFYISCIKAKTSRGQDLERLTEGMDAKRIKTLFSWWHVGTSHYEFVKSHPYSKKLIEEGKPTIEEAAGKIVSDFVKNPEYRPGDARRFLGGLFVAGRLVTRSKRSDDPVELSGLQQSERIGNSADYLITQYDAIHGIVTNVIKRIKKGDIQIKNDGEVEICKSVRDGTYNLEEEKSYRDLRRAITGQFSDEERSFFVKRNNPGKYVSDNEVNKIIYFYVKNEGKKILS